MKRVAASLSSAFVLVLAAAPSPVKELCAGIVYGPKAAFQISAPGAWVLSNEAGQDQGLPCVLYPRASSWGQAATVIYAKIASPQFTNAEEFSRWAIGELKKETNTFQARRVDSGNTPDGHVFIVNEYLGGLHGNIERVAYVQLPGAVAYVVLSARTEAAYSQHAGALSQVLGTFKYRPEFIGYVPETRSAPN